MLTSKICSHEVTDMGSSGLRSHLAGVQTNPKGVPHTLESKVHSQTPWISLPGPALTHQLCVSRELTHHL